MSPIAVEPKLTGALPRLLHSLLAEHCGTPREPRALSLFAVHVASVAVGMSLLLAWPMHRLCCEYGRIGETIAFGLYVAVEHHTPWPIYHSVSASAMLRCTTDYHTIA